MNTGEALRFLIETLFNFYAYIVFARFLLQLVRADFYNPISQFVVKATNPVIIPLRRIIPGFGGMDIASLIIVALLMFIKVAVLAAVLGFSLQPMAIGIIGLKEIGSLVLNFFFFTIIISVILSWVGGGQYNPAGELISQLTEPVLAPVRKIVPPMGGLDLTPMIVLLLISMIKILFGL